MRKKEVFEGSIFDGEIIKTKKTENEEGGSWNYLIHDCLVYNGTSFMESSHRLRYACVVDFIIKRYVNKPSDCFNINLKENGIENIDVYFYDADHRTQDQYDALDYYIDSLSDIFIFIVDDWNGTGDYDVSGGTYNAIKDLNLTIHLDASKHDNSNPEGYHNGFGIFVLEKNK